MVSSRAVCSTSLSRFQHCLQARKEGRYGVMRTMMERERTGGLLSTGEADGEGEAIERSAIPSAARCVVHVLLRRGEGRVWHAALCWAGLLAALPRYGHSGVTRARTQATATRRNTRAEGMAAQRGAQEQRRRGRSAGRGMRSIVLCSLRASCIITSDTSRSQRYHACKRCAARVSSDTAEIRRIGPLVLRHGWTYTHIEHIPVRLSGTTQ